MGFKSNNFIEHSIKGALFFLKETIFSEQYAQKKGFLQSLDPRIKTVTILMFIIQALLRNNIFILLCFYFLCFLLTLFSRIGLGFFLKRTWFFIPLFSLFIALPALFSFFTPGEAMITFKIMRFVFTITRQGMASAGLFVARVIVCVSFSALLALTTRHFELLKVLRIFGVPQIFVMVAGMCYRYVYLFVEIMENMYTAVKSRAGRIMGYKTGQNIVAGNIAFVWARSYQLNEDVYKAMLSRGYRGEPAVLNDFKTRPKDWLWLACSVLIILASI